MSEPPTRLELLQRDRTACKKMLAALDAAQTKLDAQRRALARTKAKARRFGVRAADSVPVDGALATAQKTIDEERAKWTALRRQVLIEIRKESRS